MEEKIHEAYEQYVGFCKQNGVTPSTFKAFSVKLNAMAATVAAEMIAGQVTDPSEAHYIGVSVKSAPRPGVAAVTRPCIQCGLEVWIHTQMIDRADASKGVICDLCAPEVTGKTMEQLIAEQIARI